jgi:uncharacterized protein (TIRG00374 family)
MKKLFRLALGIFISIFFLYLVFRKVNINEIIQIIVSSDTKYLVIALFLSTFVLYIRCFRWRLILGSEHNKIKIINLFSSLCIGQMVNNILPFRIGDITQAYMLGYKENCSKSVVFSTVVMKRLFDLVPPVMIIIIGSFFVLLPKQFNLFKITIFFLLVIIIVFTVIKSRKNVQKLIKTFLPESTLREKLVNLIENFYFGLQVINNKKIIFSICCYTLFIWLIYTMIVWACSYAFDIKLNILQTAIVMSITAMSVIIPASPGYVGTWEAFAVLALKIFGIEKARAVSFALTYHFVSWLPVTILGLYFFISSGISISQIQQD